ncbi:beta-galactosidase [bacterium]|nr:beta-galactosidase [bacterium]
MRMLTVCTILLALPAALFAACTVQQQTVGGEPVVVLDNDLVRVTVAPMRGGQISDIVLKATGKHLCAEETGLFVDRVWNYDDPQIYQQWEKLPYEFKLKGGGTDAAVELTRRGNGDVAGRMIVHKTFSLTDGSAAIRADYRFEIAQEAMTPMRIGMWFHGRPGVRGEKNTFVLPSDGKIQEIAYGAGAKGEYWWYQPERGWLAARGESGDGLAICMEYKRLMLFYQWLHDAMPGLEWAFRSFDIQNGESLDTTVWLVPFQGLPNVTGAAPEVVGALEIAPQVAADAKEVPFKVTLSGSGPAECTLRTYIKGPDGQESKRTESQLTLKPLPTFSASTDTFVKPAGPGTYVVRAVVEIGGKSVLEFERPCIVRQATGQYALQPLEQRLGREGEKFGDKMATAGNAPPDLKLSGEIVTPHTPWARPYARGKTRALIINSYLTGRETIELAQRLDLDYVAPTVGSSYELGYTIGLLPREINLKQSQGYVRAALKQDYDVILIGGLTGAFFDQELLDAIFAKVRNGTGLVWVQPNKLPAEAEALLPLTQFKPTNLPQLTWKKTADHALTAGLPWEALPQTGCSAYKANGELLALAGDRPLLAVREEGKGRIVGLGYNTSWQGPGSYSNGITPWVRNATQQFPYWDYHYGLLARAMLWAARREPELRVKEVSGQLPGDPISSSTEGVIGVTVDNPGPARQVEAWVGIRDEFGQVEAQSTLKCQVPTGVGAIYPKWPGRMTCGLHLVDVILREGGKVVAWGSGAVKPSMQWVATLKDLKTDKECYGGGDTLAATVGLTGAAPGRKLTLQWLLTDALGRLLATQTVPVEAGKSEATGTLAVPEPLAQAGVVRAVLLDEGKPLSVQQAQVLLMPTRTARRDWNPMTWTLWGNPAGAYSVDSLHQVASDQCRRMGLDTVQVSSSWLQPEENRSNYEAGFRLMPYGIGGNPLRLPERQGRDGKPGFHDLQEQYVKTHDKQYLVRPVSLEDPAMRAEQAKQIAERVKVLAPFKPMGYCLGDELGTTYYTTPFDFDFSPVSLAAFRQWLQTQYADLAALNREWETQFATWDEVMPMTALEVAKRGNYAPWADHRTYMEFAFADYMKFVRDEVRKTDPEGRIGISGTQAAEAYGGFDWWRLAHTLDFIQAYDHQNTGEMHRSFGMVSLPWWGYASLNPDLSYTMWNRFLNQARGGSFFVYNYMLNPDMTLPKSAADGLSDIRDQQAGLGLLLALCARPPDVLVHYSQASIHAAYICDNDDLFRNNRDGWMRAIDDCGMQADFISYAEIENGKLATFKAAGTRPRVLILPYSQALSAKEVEAIRAFVQAGGVVIADGRPGLMDEHCRTLPQGALDEVFGIASKPDGVEKMLQGDLALRGLKVDDYCASPSLTLTTGKARADIAGKPAYILNQYGKGGAILLNMFLNSYPRRQELGAENVLSAFVHTVFDSIGAESYCEVSVSSGHRVKVRHFVNGAAHYVGFLRDTKPGGCTVSTVQKLGMQVYDARQGKYVGTGRLSFEMTAGEARLLTLLPEQVAAVRVQASATKLAPGAQVQYTVAALGQKTKLPRAFGVEVTDPAGTLRSYYGAQLAATQDVARGSFQLALNDTPGKWQIVATDLATGTKGAASFTVTP